jgi:hypothetical protein
MIVERYISRTNTRIEKRGQDVQKTLDRMSKTMTQTRNQSSLTKTQNLPKAVSGTNK